MSKYSTLIILILMLLLLAGGWYEERQISAFKQRIDEQSQLIEKQSNKLKEQLTELNLLRTENEQKEISIRALQNLNLRQQENLASLQKDLSDLEQISAGLTEKQLGMQIDKEVEVVEPKIGKKYMELRNSIIGRYR